MLLLASVKKGCGYDVTLSAVVEKYLEILYFEQYAANAGCFYSCVLNIDNYFKHKLGMYLHVFVCMTCRLSRRLLTASCQALVALATLAACRCPL